MPIFEYKCAACGKEFEEVVFGDAKPDCPDCGSKDTEKLMSCCRHKTGGAGGLEMPSSSSSSSSGGCSGCVGGNCSSCGG
ncbi:MAG: FmdB family zinc ribbon protein [Desulfovibrio sp.]|uniref:FmdB family zinc ribbon protein n=1 Tax=Desulfovibrio sp. 7SRBS1 TaxID=3378064 RepID=UPI003B3EDF92